MSAKNEEINSVLYCNWIHYLFPNWRKFVHDIVQISVWSRIINVFVKKNKNKSDTRRHMNVGWLIIWININLWLHKSSFRTATFLCNSVPTLSDCFVIPASPELMCYEKRGRRPRCFISLTTIKLVHRAGKQKKDTGSFQSKLSAAHLYRANNAVFRNRYFFARFASL